MMTKTELAETLGIVNDPDENKVSIKSSSKALVHAISALKLQEQQKREYGSLNPDLWLELVPWHSLN